MIRRLPILPTIVVVAAAALMVGLGFWQIQRARWKEGLLARYANADRQPPIVWPTVPLRQDLLPLFRHATGVCLRPVGQRAVAGENRAGEPGYVHIVDCVTGAEGPGMSVEVGWSKNPNARVNWPGGPVSGVIAPDRRTAMRLVAGSAPTGLEPSAPPSLSAIPNNHRFYAVQWFAFAAIALLIYALAVRKRLKETPPPQ
ncbi:SURF1 family protein [Sphingomonas sp. URHD0057]|uniref:SURF1 family protein n=1 Tax=Sphingomonas sp. URHD0057 TaxID=1380389 RepID=UPI00055E8CBE|nr:SURF1 family protein [Sphingomonas sp. URHD0057]